MTLADWPDCLPLPQVIGYGISLADANNVRGGGNFGPAVSRNRFTRQAASTQTVYVMSEVQLGIFEAWWKHIIYDGSAWFTQQQGGESLQDNTVRFVGGYAVTMQNAGTWVVTCQQIIDDPYRSA